MGIDAEGNANEALAPVVEGTLNIAGSVYEDTYQTVAAYFKNLIINAILRKANYEDERKEKTARRLYNVLFYTIFFIIAGFIKYLIPIGFMGLAVCIAKDDRSYVTSK